MKIKEIKHHLRKAVNEAPVNILEDIKHQKVEVMKNHDYITRQEPIKKKSLKPIYAFTTISVILVIAISMFYQGDAITSQVFIDINPGIEISLNKNENVINMEAINIEEDVILSIDYYRKNVYQVIPMLLDMLSQNGFINEDKNTMLVSIKSVSDKISKENIEKLSSTIKSFFTVRDSSVLILKQEIKEDDEAIKGSYKDYLTAGKYTFIKNLTKLDSDLIFEDLVYLSLKELIELSKDISLDLTSIIESDEDVYQYYDEKMNSQLSLESAIEIALGLSNGGVVENIELEEDDGRLYYEIEIRKENQEFEIVLDALTGQVLEFEKDIDFEYDHINGSDEILDIKEISVIALDFTKGGVIIEIELNFDDSKSTYEVIVRTETAEHILLINAHTGEIIKAEYDRVDDKIISNNILSIKEIQDKVIELTDGGLVKQIELEEDDGRLYYEIEIKRESQEIELVLDAYTGQVLEYENENELDQAHFDKLEEILDIEKISSIALEFTKGGVIIEIELEHEDNTFIYKITIVSEAREHILMINARSGEIIKAENETTDDKFSDKNLISAKEALNKAYELTNGGTLVDIELNKDDGKFIYEIEIEKDSLEYEIEVDGQSGEIISFDH
jgi:uncharacterized membrane protein YkoI